MYNSPIEIITTEITRQINKQTEEAVYQALQSIGVNVNKDELIKALQYDRDQYDKGYADGVRAVIAKIREKNLETFMLQGWVYADVFLDSIAEEMGCDAE